MTAEAKTAVKDPVLGYNRDGVRIMTEQESKKVNEINEAFQAVDDFFGEKPTEKQRREILEKGYDFVLEKLKAKFPFPNATKEFNYEAMGVDPSPLESLLTVASKRHKFLEYSALNGAWFEITEKGHQAIKSKHAIIANTDKQKEALKFAEELSELFNKYRWIPSKLGFHNANFEGKERVSKILKVVNVTDKGFSPSATGIKNL
ncbi:hypothetical protein [Flagellimonas okinawensis]|uniref:Uncharacterized protein n=1 Tax=Flagellimonas okinawensis TaxID=3031324 RepID=A0ABT5XL42_9FLAO|nr:hypothetical protein [[Muricauda] okinawensis]MDF0706611.1 hypothetical protein [[Muricauda] okinawensis]